MIAMPYEDRIKICEIHLSSSCNNDYNATVKINSSPKPHYVVQVIIRFAFLNNLSKVTEGQFYY